MAAMQKKRSRLAYLKIWTLAEKILVGGSKKESWYLRLKKTFNPLVDCQLKMISLPDIAKALEGISPNSNCTLCCPLNQKLILLLKVSMFKSLVY